MFSTYINNLSDGLKGGGKVEHELRYRCYEFKSMSYDFKSTHSGEKVKF